MIKKTAIFALVVSLLLVSLSPACSPPSEPVEVEQLTILDSSVEVDFPLELRFKLSAASQANITDIRLLYTVDRESYAQVTSEAYIDFVPAPRADVSWTLEMVKIGGLPPGASVDYWWTVQDANGKQIATTPAKVQFDDKRYSWQTLTEGMVTIYWYQGEKSFADELMSAARQALSRLAGDTGAYLEKPVKLYVYASSQDLQGAMIYPQEWTGGVAFTRYGIIAIGITADNLAWGKRAVAHELTHLVVGQVTLNPYAGLPNWLEEGLAMYAEGALSGEFIAYLNKAIAEDSLISVPSLSSPFSAYAEETYLAYAQSYSLVEFLISRYGQGKMLELLNTFKEGADYDGALARVYGFDMDGLDTLWRDYAIQQYQTAKAKTTAMFPALAGMLTR